MSLTGSYIPIPIEESLIGVYVKRCNHSLCENDYKYLLRDDRTEKTYSFAKISMHFPQDIFDQISKNYNKRKAEEKLEREHRQRTEAILGEPDYHKRRKLLSKRYIKENLK